MPAVDVGANESWMEGGEAPPMAQHPGAPAHGLLVRFSLEPVVNADESAKHGRPIFDELEYVRIQVPGNKNEIVHREVRPEDKVKFPMEYRAFRMKQEAPTTGTPLTAWPGIARGQVEEMSHFGVKTVEQLAGLADNLCQQWHGVMTLRQRARDFVEAAKSTAHLEVLRAELTAKDTQMQQLTTRLEAMEAALKDKQSKKKD
jgi:hypothetical protein